MSISPRFKKAGESAGMSIIDVGILTGFSVKQESLVEVKHCSLQLSNAESLKRTKTVLLCNLY